MKNYIKNKKHLTENNAYDPSLEHEACGVGLIATTNSKKRVTSASRHGQCRESRTS